MGKGIFLNSNFVFNKDVKKYCLIELYISCKENKVLCFIFIRLFSN